MSTNKPKSFTDSKAKESIEKIDFRMVAKKMASTEGWNEADLQCAFKLYKNFLFLKWKYGDRHKLPPNKEIDEIWHNHILDTKNYISDCERIFGSYLHHYPYAGIDGITSYDQLKNYYKVTQDLHKSEFGYYIYKIRLNLFEMIFEVLKIIAKKMISLFYRNTANAKSTIS